MFLGKLKGNPVWVAVVFYFVGFSPGFWMPALPSVLQTMGHEAWIPWIYIGMPIGALISPFLLGSLSDGKVAANHLCGYVMLIGGATMTVAFTALQLGVRIEIFVFLMYFNSILSAPIWGLVTQSTLAFLSGEENRFPFYRVWGTVGWLTAGLLGGFFLQADSSALAGIIGGIARFPAGIMCFLMPYCAPQAKKKRFSILQMMSEGSRELWKNRNTRVLLLSACMISIPISSFFMYAPLQMKCLEVEKPIVWMSMAQWFEIPAIFTLGLAVRKIRMKWLITFGLAVTVFRQIMFIYSARTGQFWPMPLGFLTHGLTFSYFMTVAQMYMEKRVSSDLRGRAQGMLSLMFSGIGNLTGVLLMGWFFRYFVDTEANTGWEAFWGTVALFSLLPTLYFLIRYQKLENT